MEVKKSPNRKRSSLYLHNQAPYIQTDGTSGISASNRSSYPLDRRCDCRRRSQWMEVKKSPNRTRCSLYLHNQAPYIQTENGIEISASNSFPSRRSSDLDCR